MQAAGVMKAGRTVIAGGACPFRVLGAENVRRPGLRQGSHRRERGEESLQDERVERDHPDDRAAVHEAWRARAHRRT
ncbi:hypothetical protein ACFQWF_09900 [Methylorubrum suomiense]